MPISARRPRSPIGGRPSTCRSLSTLQSEQELVDRLVNAGEILVGQHTLFCAGNFVIGCPASLPTGGFAHVSSGITADAFLKRTAVARADATARRRMTPTIVAMSNHEGFPAHANAAQIRSRLILSGSSAEAVRWFAYMHIRAAGTTTIPAHDFEAHDVLTPGAR